MSYRPATTNPIWPSVALIVGGLVMAVLWFRFTTLHGPTSFNEERRWLGLDPLVWGSLMNAPPSLLIALGLCGHRSLLVASSSRIARIGFVLVMLSLTIPSLVELATLTLGPPLALPVLATGLILLGVDQRRHPSLPAASRAVLQVLGVLLLTTFLLVLAVPLTVSDSYDGYRIYGLTAHVTFGLGWMLFGVALLRQRRHLSVTR